MATRTSNYYTLNPDNRSYNGNAPQDVRAGEPVWVRAQVTFPAGTVAADIGRLCQVVPGVRIVSGFVTASAANGSLVANLGFNSAPTAFGPIAVQAPGSTAFTPTQIAAVTALPIAGDDLILTLSGTFTNPTTITVWAEMANLNS